MEKTYDIIVTGGGLTGIAAAVAAAREGAHVLIVEKNGFLGGAAGINFVNPFMGYAIHHPETGQDEVINAGLFWEILQRLNVMGGLHEKRIIFNEEILKIILDRLTREHGVDVLMHAYLTGCDVEGRTVRSLEAVGKSGVHRLAAKGFLDATGDADLAVLAGCSTRLGRDSDQQCQPMTLCFRVANVDMEAFEKGRRDITPLYQKLQKEGKIQNPREDVLLFYHMAPGVIHFNSTRIIHRNPVDDWDRTAAEMEAREQMLELFTFLREHCQGFANAVLLASAPEIGVRESRLIDGLYLLQAEELLACTHFDDSIARGSYSVDIHSPDGSGTVIRRIPQGQYYTIPYRSLVPPSLDNLLVAGRCISATHEAQSACRIMPICCCMGEAAGLALQMALADGCPAAAVDIGRLHDKMDQYGMLY